MSGRDGESAMAARATAAFGDDLRAVVRCRATGGAPTFEVEYVREDVAAAAEEGFEAVAADIARDYAFESVEREWHEGVHRAGRFRASVRVFEAAAELRLYREGAGYAVAVDAAALPAVGEFLAEVGEGR